MIGKRIKNKIKKIELLKKKEGKKLANISIILLFIISVVSPIIFASGDVLINESVPVESPEVSLKIDDNVTQFQIINVPLFVNNLTHLKLHIAKYEGIGTVSNNLNISITPLLPWEAGPPNPADTRTISLTPAQVPTLGATWDNVTWYDWDFADMPRNYTQYTIEIRTDEPQNISHYYVWQYDKDDIYPGTSLNVVTYFSSNSTYVNYTSWDAAFKIYGISNYTYTENFDTDTTGAITLSPDNPSENWYNLSSEGVGYSLNTSVVNVSTSVYQGTKSLFVGTGTDPEREGVSFNFTNSSIDYIKFSVYPTVDTGDHVINFFLANGSTKAIHIAFNAGYPAIQIREGAVNTDLLNPYTANTWYNFSVSINWTTHKTGVVLNGVDKGWFDFRDISANSVNAFVIIGDDTTNLNSYIDSIEIGSPTQLYSGGVSSYPSPPTSFTATAYNETQINLTWVKGTGATNTIIRYATADPGTWTLSTGTLLYNGTGTSATHTGLSAGDHIWYAAWSWNSTGYSQTYVTADNTTVNPYLISDNGIFEYLTKPCAIYYHGVYNRTYITFIDNTGKIKIKYYDHDNDTFSSEYTVYDIGSSDDHAAPSMLINDTGHIVVFFTDGHNDPLYVSASSSSEDISSWQTPTLIHSGYCTYPKPWQDSSGVYHVTYRYWTSSSHRYVIHSWSSDLSTWVAI